MPTGFQGEITSKEILEKLTTGVDFSIPSIDLNDPNLTIPSHTLEEILKVIPKVTIDDLTTGTVDGTGCFDILMKALKAHLYDEYSSGRIIGAEYAKAYIASTQVAMQNAVQFVLQKDAAYWSAIQAQLGAINSNIAVLNAKVALATAKIQAHTAKAQYALTVMKLGTEDTQFGVGKEQVEQVRAQTLDTRTDGASVVGQIGKQKDLYSQQIDSYKKDANLKAAKVFSDAWVTQKSIDEGVEPPVSFQKDAIERVLNELKKVNQLP